MDFSCLNKALTYCSLLSKHKKKYPARPSPTARAFPRPGRGLEAPPVTTQNAGRWRQSPKGRGAPVRRRRQSRALPSLRLRSVPGRGPGAGAALTIAPRPPRNRPGTAPTAPPRAATASLRAGARDKRAGGAERGSRSRAGVVPAAAGGGRRVPAVRVCEGAARPRWVRLCARARGAELKRRKSGKSSCPVFKVAGFVFPTSESSFHLLHQLLNIKTFLCVL